MTNPFEEKVGYTPPEYQRVEDIQFVEDENDATAIEIIIDSSLPPDEQPKEIQQKIKEVIVARH